MIIENKKYQPYFKQFIRIKGLNIGDEWKTHHYISWIQERHKQFRIKFGLRHVFPTKEYSEKFIKWLKSLEQEDKNESS